LFGWRWCVSREPGSSEEVRFVDEDLVRLIMDMVKVALAANGEFSVCPIGEHAEHGHGRPKVLQEQDITQQLDKYLAFGDELLVRFIGRNEAKVEIRVGISLAPRVGAVEGSGDNPLIGLAGCDETVHDDLVLRRWLSCVRIHAGVSP
jgi:hypothetical protein